MSQAEVKIVFRRLVVDAVGCKLNKPYSQEHWVPRLWGFSPATDSTHRWIPHLLLWSHKLLCKSRPKHGDKTLNIICWIHDRWCDRTGPWWASPWCWSLPPSPPASSRWEYTWGHPANFHNLSEPSGDPLLQDDWHLALLLDELDGCIKSRKERRHRTLAGCVPHLPHLPGICRANSGEEREEVPTLPFPKRYSCFRLKSENCSIRHVLSQIYTSVPTHTHSWNCQCRCLPKTVDQDSVWANARWPSQVLSACELFLVLPLSLLLPNPSSRDRLFFLSGHRLRTSFDWRQISVEVLLSSSFSFSKQ